ncbi:hypothetical protein [Streptomyces sp. NPDC018031]|uniref:hypothetical protein n=1 Tax=Streptomyces sp. NPDC018031 TaxID=3365033 RepID=UPI0037BA9315
MRTDLVHPWAPPLGPEVIALHAGEAWDAVRVTEPIGTAVLEALGGASGSVISGGHGRSLYWLVPREEARDWRLPHVEVLPRSDREIAVVGVPPAASVKGPGVHWLVPWRPARYLTDPALLHAALTAAVAAPAPAEGAR